MLLATTKTENTSDNSTSGQFSALSVSCELWPRNPQGEAPAWHLNSGEPLSYRTGRLYRMLRCLVLKVFPVNVPSWDCGL